MRIPSILTVLMAGGVLVASPAFAQQKADNAQPHKQATQDGGSLTTVGPASGAYKQRTQDGNSPTLVGPASGAYKQRTQSLAHSDPTAMKKE